MGFQRGKGFQWDRTIVSGIATGIGADPWEALQQMKQNLDAAQAAIREKDWEILQLKLEKAGRISDEFIISQKDGGLTQKNEEISRLREEMS